MISDGAGSEYGDVGSDPDALSYDDVAAGPGYFGHPLPQGCTIVMCPSKQGNAVSGKRKTSNHDVA